MYLQNYLQKALGNQAASEFAPQATNEPQNDQQEVKIDENQIKNEPVPQVPQPPPNNPIQSGLNNMMMNQQIPPTTNNGFNQPQQPSYNNNQFAQKYEQQINTSSNIPALNPQSAFPNRLPQTTEVDKSKQSLWKKKEETVSKLSPQQLAMPRISVYITVPDKGQKFLAYLDRRVHHTVKDFKLYLAQSIQIDDPDKVTLTKEAVRYAPPVQVNDLAMVNHQDKLVLRKDEWFLGRPEYQPFTMKPPKSTCLRDGSKVYLQPFQWKLDDKDKPSIKKETDMNQDDSSYTVEQAQPIFQVIREAQRQNPRFATLFRSENENTVIKTENGYIPQIKPKYLELSTQIKNLILKKLQEQKEDDELPEGVPRPKRPSGNTIIERYIDRQREEAEAELKYAKTIKLDGYKPWDNWVPMPYPHRELNFARKMYMRGDNLLVQTPDFWEFCNDMKNITNKNHLIWKVKKMSMDRGFRGKVSLHQNEGNPQTVIMICNKSGKSTAKNPSIKAECPFLLHFERKSFLQKQIRKQLTVPDGLEKLNEQQLACIKEEGGDEEVSILNYENKSNSSQNNNFDVKKFKKGIDSKLMKREGPKQDQNEIPGDPFFLTKYRSFHNHDLDTNYVEHAHMVMDEELHKKGSANLLPQAPCAIQWLSGQRRKEIPEEGKLQDMPIQFDQVTTVQTIYKLDQFGVDPNHQQMRVIEPAGMPPVMFIIDQVSPPQDLQVQFQDTDDNGNVSWPPLDSMIQEARSLICQTMRHCLEDVSVRLGDGRYNLDRWRRILTYMKPKAFAKAIVADACFRKNPTTGRLLGLTPAAITELVGANSKTRIVRQEGLTGIVNQIQSRKKGGEKKKKQQRDDSDSDDKDRQMQDEQQKRTLGGDLNENDDDMLNQEEGLVAPDDETYNIYN